MNTSLLRDLTIKAIYATDSINAPDSHKMYIPDSFRDEFVKLILRECIDIIEHGMDHTDYESSAESLAELRGQQWCREAIKERFGIE
jgi:hypothetical protein